MTEKTLLSLKEISRELNLNYRTLLNIRNQMISFFPGRHDGKNFKYLSECTELFSLIHALREEGYTFSMIRYIFLGLQHIENDPQINGWVTEVVAKFSSYWSELVQTSTDWHKLAQTSADLSELVRISTNQFMPVQTSTDQSESVYTSKDQSELAYTSEDQSKEDTGAFGDNKEILEERLNQIKEEILAEVSDQIDTKIRERTQDIQDRLENALLQYKAGVNGALTQVYKAVKELQAGIQTLDQRLGHLESELENEQGETIHLQDIDLEALQIQSPELEISDKDELKENPEVKNFDSGIDLEQVKNSIYNGRPNREVIIQWIKSVKTKDPNVSYGSLANRLNDAGIPTLSGRDTWCRTVIRSLAIKE